MNYNFLHETFSSSLFKDRSSLERYFLSSNIYAKYYIRVVDSTEIRDKEIKLYTFDNTFNVFNLAFNRRRKKLPQFDLEVGSSLGLNLFKYQNKFNDEWSFKSLLPTYKIRTNFGTMRIFRYLKSINSKKFYSLFFLKPNKGGFLIYSNGAKSFLPQSHFKHVIPIFSFAFKSIKSHKNIDVLSRLLKNWKNSVSIPFRLPYLKVQLSIWKMARIRYNFSSAKKRKRRRNLTKFRIVILYREKRKKKIKDLKKPGKIIPKEKKKKTWIQKRASQKKN